MPWFVQEAVDQIKKVPSFIDSLLTDTIVYERPPSMLETPVAEASEPEPTTPKLEGEWIGTNYDPLDIWQNRPDATPENLGKGAAGVKIDESMVAVSRKKGTDEAMIRLGTVLRDPETGKKYLVADLMNRRFDGQNKIDFATPKRGKEIDANYNRTFSGFEIVREGQGYEDVRNFVESGEWDKMKE